MDAVSRRRYDAGCKHLLLQSEGTNYTLLDSATGQTIGKLENASQARLTNGHIVLVRGSFDDTTAVEGWTIKPFQIAWSMPIVEHVSLGEIVDNTLICATRHTLSKVALPGNGEMAFELTNGRVRALRIRR